MSLGYLNPYLKYLLVSLFLRITTIPSDGTTFLTSVQSEPVTVIDTQVLITCESTNPYSLLYPAGFTGNIYLN